jgi:shikimate kinase
MTITINGSGTVTGIIAGGLPDAIITQPELATGVAGTGPAFSAYANAVQTVSNNTFTKISFQVEDFDTASAFDNVTNYRFTPQVAGYYQANGLLFLTGTATTTQEVVALFKNGTTFARLTDNGPSSALASNGSTTFGNSILVYLNGSTDYIELYGYYNGGTATFSSVTVSLTSRFSASMVRSA